MCIRDRRFSQFDRCDADPARGAEDKQRVAFLNMSAIDQRCLLYTSDAADERSSVDLGGRRIIKKKKCDSRAGAAVPIGHERYKRHVN